MIQLHSIADLIIKLIGSISIAHKKILSSLSNLREKHTAQFFHPPYGKSVAIFYWLEIFLSILDEFFSCKL